MACLTTPLAKAPSLQPGKGAHHPLVDWIWSPAKVLVMGRAGRIMVLEWVIFWLICRKIIEDDDSHNDAGGSHIANDNLDRELASNFATFAEEKIVAYTDA